MSQNKVKTTPYSPVAISPWILKNFANAKIDPLYYR